MNTSKSRFRKSALAIAVAAGLATALVAVAQPGPGYGPGMMGGGGPGMTMGAGPGMMGRGGPGMMTGGGPGPMFAGNNVDIARFQQDRLGQLKSQLNITAEQQPAWDAFAAKAAEQSKIMQALRKDASAATMPERMKQQEQAMGERQKAMGSMSESFTKLYEVLTPQQREVFDRSYRPIHRHG